LLLIAVIGGHIPASGASGIIDERIQRFGPFLIQPFFDLTGYANDLPLLHQVPGKPSDIGIRYAEPDILVGFFTIGGDVAYGENAITLTRQKTGGFKAYSRCGAGDDDGLFHCYVLVAKTWESVLGPKGLMQPCSVDTARIGYAAALLLRAGR
jgi:hypothetical protein